MGGFCGFVRFFLFVLFGLLDLGGVFAVCIEILVKDGK